ncbi:unnamed protein product [Caenorhabditis nigoni]
MLSAANLLLVFFAIHPMISSEDPLNTDFETLPQSNIFLHNNLKYYKRVSKNLLPLGPENPTTVDDPCYKEFHDSKATFLVFWREDGAVYCESVKKSIGKVQPSFPAQNLIRVERLIRQGPNAETP